MGMIEAPFADLVLGIMQNGYVRWCVAAAVVLWVWIVGYEDARLRKLYLAAPVAVALLIQLAEVLLPGAARGGQGGFFEIYLAAIEALRQMATPLGLIAMLAALASGYARMIGGAALVVVLATAYFADQTLPQAKSFFSGPVLAQMLALAPAVVLVLLSAYGLGATLRHLRERYHVA